MFQTKNMSRRNRLLIVFVSMLIGAAGVVLWSTFSRDARVLQKTTDAIIELRTEGNSAIAASDTDRMEEVASALLKKYKRLQRVDPSFLAAYHDSVSEWSYLNYMGAEQVVAQNLVAAANDSIATTNFEKLKQILKKLEIQKVRLDRAAAAEIEEELFKFYGYHVSVIEWSRTTLDILVEIVRARPPPESGQIVWGEVPVFPALEDIPIDGGMFASVGVVYGPQPDEVYYGLPPTMRLWDAMGNLTPVCQRTVFCDDVSPPDPPLRDMPLPFITLENGQLLTGIGIISDEYNIAECSIRYPYFRSDGCFACPRETPYYNESNNTCQECARSSSYKHSDGKCYLCPEDTPFYNENTGKCQATTCGVHSSPAGGGQCRCDSGYEARGGECVVQKFAAPPLLTPETTFPPEPESTPTKKYTITCEKDYRSVGPTTVGGTTYCIVPRPCSLGVCPYRAWGSDGSYKTSECLDTDYLKISRPTCSELGI